MASDDRLSSRRPVVTTAERERSIALLSDRFAHGDLDMEEFEERLTLAHRAQTAEELAALTADLAAPAAAIPAAQDLQLVTEVPAQGNALAIFGGTRRDGAWTVPRRLRVTAVFGGVELDLRQARLPAGSIDVEVTAVFGGVQLIVPPTLAAEIHGSAILGGFDQMDRTPATPDPAVPVLRIRGLAVMGGVNVETRLPGESSLAAHRRRRRERRARRHAG
jgi:hypothetical protein